MGTGITDVVGGPHDFLPPMSDRSDEFQKLCKVHLKSNKIKKHDIPDLYRSLHRIRLFRILFTVPATWQCVDHKNVVVLEAL
jgi:hypothetical protein